MGVYYAAIDYDANEIIHPGEDQSIKFPGVISKGHKFPGVVMLANYNGGNFILINDSSNDDAYHDARNDDVSEKWYERYNSLFEELVDEPPAAHPRERYYSLFAKQAVLRAAAAERFRLTGDARTPAQILSTAKYDQLITAAEPAPSKTLPATGWRRLGAWLNVIKEKTTWWI